MMMCWDLEIWKFFKKIEEFYNEISVLDFLYDGRIFVIVGKVGYEICNIIIIYGMLRFVLYLCILGVGRKWKEIKELVILW